MLLDYIWEDNYFQVEYDYFSIDSCWGWDYED